MGIDTSDEGNKVNFDRYLGRIAKSNPPQTIREHTDNLLKCAAVLKEIYKINEEIYSLLLSACEYHDYGKMNDEFQKRIKEEKHFNEEKEIAHNILSGYFVDGDLLGEDYYNVLYAVMYHHKLRKPIEKVLDEEQKRVLIEQLLKPFPHKELDEFEVMDTFMSVRNEPKTILIKGLLHRCDYAASANVTVEYPNDFLNQQMDSLLLEWKSKNKSAEWREMQTFCKEHQDDNLIITAPTGLGKTEAGLLWIGDGKGSYILPLITAINSIFKRIAEVILKDEKIEQRLSLLHSGAMGYLSKQEEYRKLDLYDYQTRSRQLSFPLTVSTLDQIFDFVLKTSGYEMKLATLAYSKVVIDEIQAYDARLLAYLVYGIHKIIELGGKVAIMTATLPGYIKDYIVGNQEQNSYGFIERDYSSKEYNIKIRHHLKVIDSQLSVKDITEQYRKGLHENESNKILVICNTVIKAQQIYDLIVQDLNEISGVEIHLLHAKFIRKDRSELEQQITDDGKTEQHKNVIWITTQVVEASLDIDFDYLYTELSDLSSLFQRLGRCNRKGMKAACKANCFVYIQINPRLLIDESGKSGFIDSKLYELSVDALKEVNGTITEEQKVDLINRYFSTEKMEGSHFVQQYEDMYEYVEGLEVDTLTEEDMRTKFRNILSEQVIPLSIYEENSELIQNNLKIIRKPIPNCNEQERNNIWKEKQAAKDHIMDLTVNVGRRDVFSSGARYELIKLNCHENVYVIPCEYSKEKGYQRYVKAKDIDMFV